MATCNECIHERVCFALIKTGLPYVDNDLPAEAFCMAFKPTADVAEVVRCKDCKYYIPDSELDYNEYPNDLEADGLCDNIQMYTDGDEYCSHGVRKESDT